MPELVNLKVAELRKRGYNDISEWLADPQHLYIGRKMRIFIHTKQRSKDAPGTRVTRNENDEKVLTGPNGIVLENVASDNKLLSYPVGSHVNKHRKIIHLCIIPQSKWYNPFKVKTVTNRTQVTDEYAQYLENNKSLLNALSELDNYTEIGCWCKPKRCHGDTIMSFYNKIDPETDCKCPETDPKESRKRKRTENEDDPKTKKMKLTSASRVITHKHKGKQYKMKEKMPKSDDERECDKCDAILKQKYWECGHVTCSYDLCMDCAKY
eukprot:70538_1